LIGLFCKGKEENTKLEMVKYGTRRYVKESGERITAV
jgi:hypothetical protein